MYSKKVLDLFFNPKFFGKMKKPDAVGKAGNPVCGDRLTFYLKIGAARPPRRAGGKTKKLFEKSSRKGMFEKKSSRTGRTGKIKDVSYETLGCSVAISVSEVICKLIKGKTLDYASQLNHKDVLKKLGKVPAIKIHCSYLGIDALRKAIDSYRKK